MGTDGASILLGIFGLLVNLTFLAFVAVQVSLLRKQMRGENVAAEAERLRVQRQATVEFAANTLQRRHEFALELPMESDSAAVSRYLKEVKSDHKRLQRLYSYLNYWEEFASAVNVGVFDAEVVSRTAGDVVIRIEEAYRPFVVQIRLDEDRPFLYTEIEQLARSMRALDEERRVALESLHLAAARQIPA